MEDAAFVGGCCAAGRQPASLPDALDALFADVANHWALALARLTQVTRSTHLGVPLMEVLDALLEFDLVDHFH